MSLKVYSIHCIVQSMYVFMHKRNISTVNTYYIISTQIHAYLGYVLCILAVDCITPYLGGWHLSCVRDRRAATLRQAAARAAVWSIECSAAAVQGHTTTTTLHSALCTRTSTGSEEFLHTSPAPPPTCPPPPGGGGAPLAGLVLVARLPRPLPLSRPPPAASS